MQRYFAEDKKGNKLILKKEDIHHIKNVMRNKAGDKIECVFSNELYICKIENINSNEVVIENKKEENNELDIDLTIAIALVKEQKIDLILQKLTELGVNKIIPVQMERSIVKLDKERFKKKKERWISICKEAAEQSKRTSIPQIDNITKIDELEVSEYDIKLTCSTKEKDNILPNYLNTNLKEKHIIAIIGPEGGITEKEEEKLNKLGFISTSLGNRIMRVETAAIYIASIINYCSMR